MLKKVQEGGRRASFHESWVAWPRAQSCGSKGSGMLAPSTLTGHRGTVEQGNVVAVRTAQGIKESRSRFMTATKRQQHAIGLSPTCVVLQQPSQQARQGIVLEDVLVGLKDAVGGGSNGAAILCAAASQLTNCQADAGQLGSSWMGAGTG